MIFRSCCLVFAVLLTVAAGAQTQLTDADLKRLGVYERGLRLADVGHDAQLLLGLERPRTGERRRGLRQRLWLLRPQSGEARSIPLTVPGVRQAMLTVDQKQAVLLTEGGTLLTVDLKGESARLLATAADLQGVVLEKLVRGPEGLFALGRDWEGDRPVALARIEPGSEVPVGLVPLPEVPEGEEARVEWASVEEGYLVHQKRLVRVCGEGAPATLSKSADWFALAATPTGCFVIGEGLHRFDQRGKSRLLGKGQSLFGNLVASEDGSRVAVCDIDLKKGRMTVLTGAAPSFDMRPVKGLTQVPLGKIMLSPEGHALVFRSHLGLMTVTLD